MPETEIDSLHDYGYDEDDSELAKTWAVLCKLASQYAQKKKTAFWDTINSLTPQMVMNLINWIKDPSRPVPKWRRKGIIQGLGGAIFNDRADHKKKKHKKRRHVHQRDLSKRVTTRESTHDTQRRTDKEEKDAKLSSLMGQLAKLKVEMSTLQQDGGSNSTSNTDMTMAASSTVIPTSVPTAIPTEAPHHSLPAPPPPPRPSIFNSSQAAASMPPPPPPPPSDSRRASTAANRRRSVTFAAVTEESPAGSMAPPPPRAPTGISSLLADIKKPHSLKHASDAKPRKSALRNSMSKENLPQSGENGGGESLDGDFLQNALQRKFRSFQRMSSDDSIVSQSSSPLSSQNGRRSSGGGAWSKLMRQDSAPKLRSSRRSSSRLGSASNRTSAATDDSEWQ